jgi:hypothetical protein
VTTSQISARRNSINALERPRLRASPAEGFVQWHTTGAIRLLAGKAAGAKQKYASATSRSRGGVTHSIARCLLPPHHARSGDALLRVVCCHRPGT